MGIISTTSNLLDKSHSDVPGSMITFTSCLPFSQKGEDVTIPLTDQAELNVEARIQAGLPGKFRAAINDAEVTTAQIKTSSGIVRSTGTMTFIMTLTVHYSPILRVRQLVSVPFVVHSAYSNGPKRTQEVVLALSSFLLAILVSPLEMSDYRDLNTWVVISNAFLLAKSFPLLPLIQLQEVHPLDILVVMVFLLVVVLVFPTMSKNQALL